MIELPDLSKIFKYFNIFSFFVKRYCQGFYTLTLVGHYKKNNERAETNGESGTWNDVFDGTMWICTYVAVITIIGYIRSIS